MSVANMSMIADDDEPPQQHYPLSSSPLSTSTLSGSGGTVIDLSASRTSTPLRVVLPMQPAKHGFYVAAAPMPPLRPTVVAAAAAGRAAVGESSDYIECSPAGTEVLLLLLLQTHHPTAQHNSQIPYNCEACTLTLFLCLCQYKLTYNEDTRIHTRHSQPPAQNPIDHPHVYYSLCVHFLFGKQNVWHLSMIIIGISTYHSYCIELSMSLRRASLLNSSHSPKLQHIELHTTKWFI